MLLRITELCGQLYPTQRANAIILCFDQLLQALTNAQTEAVCMRKTLASTGQKGHKTLTDNMEEKTASELSLIFLLKHTHHLLKVQRSVPFFKSLSVLSSV